MGFKDRVKQVFSTGQASAIDEARRLHKGGDIAGAVTRLKEALDARNERGKALAVIRELHEGYSDELNLRQLRDYRVTLSRSAFGLANHDQIEGIMTSLDRALMEKKYAGKARAEGEALYKEFHGPFQKLQLDAQRNKQSTILKKLKITDPEKSADEFIALVEKLHDLGGHLPKEMHLDYRVAQERSYILPDNLQEFDNYVIERRLGSGGFASVFLASPKGVSFQAAIKIFSPQPSLVRESGLSLAELKERFRREAGIMLSLSAEKVEGIVNARITRTWQGKPYLFMDYYPANLSALIGPDDELLQTGRGGYLGYDKALPIIRDIITSIHGLHNRPDPIIHRDLKPTNILLDANNRPYIGDFGLAREASRADLLSKAFQTVTGTNLATQYYGAPEQRGGFKDTDQRADIFSLGVLIFRMLTGRLLGFHDLEPIEHYVQALGKDMALKINDALSKSTRVEVDQRLSDVSTLLEVFSPQAAPLEARAVQIDPAPEEQFRTALELAYAFGRDGRLPENVRATLLTKARELGIGQGEAEVLENDFRLRHGLSGERDDGVVSATVGTQLKLGANQGEGTLIVTSEPEMAEVIVDGLEWGKTPLRIATVAAGKKSIRLNMPGFFPATRIELIEPDKEAKIHVILEPQTSNIKVGAETFSDAYPPRFYLDGKLMGRAPLTVRDVMAGSHTYKCEADGHKEVSGEVRVSLDEEAIVWETLEPVHGKLSVASVPEGAAIWIDGKDTGKKTDHLMEVLAGEHQLTLKLDGYKDTKKKVRLEPEGFIEVEIRLEKGLNAPLLEPTFTDPITGMEFVHVPGGKFMMGDVFGDGYEEEKPVHEVELDGFYIGKYPVTQGEWEEVMGDNPSKFQKGDEYPVESVSWDEAQEFIKMLIFKNKGRYQFRLPTEAEWEYAARSGGKKEKYAGGDDVDAVAWHSENIGNSTTYTVGQKAPNGLGIYDMSGNLSEWCQDWYGDYPSESVANPKGPSTGSARVNRGGGWFSHARYCRSALRNRREPDRGSDGLGFRLARSVSTTAPLAHPASNEINRDGVFVANANGIVIDTSTGLEWMAGPDRNMNWDEAESWVQSLNIDGGGWRMPTMYELESLYKEGSGSRNMTPLLKTTGWWVWSGETKGSSRAWYFYFGHGRRRWVGRGDGRIVRAFAVRSRGDAKSNPQESQPYHFSSTVNETDRNGDYVAYGNGVVVDNKTGLEWKVGPDKDTSWNEAKAWVASLNLDGGGWRMPSMDELEGLYREGAGDRNRTPLLKTTGWWVWSSATYGASSAWGFSFHYGSRISYYRDYSGRYPRAFAVRSRSDGADNETLGGKVKPRHTAPPPTSNGTERDGIYVAYANEVVRDTRTGLEWKVGPDKDTNWNEAKAWVESLNLDGGGWRMPTMNELEDLSRKGSGSQDMTPLAKATEWWVWSGETKGLSYAWSFYFGMGDGDWLYRTDPGGRALAVRSRTDGANDEKLGDEVKSKYTASPPTSNGTERDSDYVASGSGIVKDNKTGLEWVAGPDRDMTWEEARSWVNSLNIDGGGWRMPITDELEGLYWEEAGLRNMTPLLKTTGWWVWSAETEGSSGARGFYFDNGNGGWRDRSISHDGRAFAVRSRTLKPAGDLDAKGEIERDG